MSEAKIEIKVGSVSFSGEGDGKWLSEQLDKILEKLPELAQAAPASTAGTGGSESNNRTLKPKGTLAIFLRDKNATTNQVRKFLATSIWLHDRDSKARLTTSDVTKALSDSQQTRLGNPADCLNKNVNKGFCEKNGKEFFATDGGRAEIG
jgi:hypothetical protein